jgi:competence ComEA-like helix-hairpin-helix protein
MPPKPVLTLVLLALLGHAARLLLVEPGSAAGGIEIVASGSSPPASALAHKDSIAALSKPLADGERINLDRASVPEIARLPRVGVALAKRIVADRTAQGQFGSLAAVDRVSGVGPGLLAAIAPHVTFSAGGGGSLGPPLRSGAGAGSYPIEKDQLTSRRPPADTGFSLAWLNQATANQLDRLPGIGRVRAAAIVRYRDEHGPFASVADLRNVPGINPAQLQRLYDHIQVP